MTSVPYRSELVQHTVREAVWDQIFAKFHCQVRNLIYARVNAQAYTQFYAQVYTQVNGKQE